MKAKMQMAERFTESALPVHQPTSVVHIDALRRVRLTDGAIPAALVDWAWDFQDRINADHHLFHVQSGHGSYTCADRRISLRPGRFFWFTPGTRHSRSLELSGSADFTFLRFSTAHPFPAGGWHFDAQPSGLEASLLLHAAHTFEWQGDVPAVRLQLGALLAILLENEHRGANKPARLTHLLAAMAAAPDEAWPLTRMASMVSVSPKHLTQLFRQETGRTPHQHLLEIRIRLAGTLIGESDASLSTIAQICGFSDAFALSKAYRRVLGEPPSALRRRWEPQTEKNRFGY